MIHHITAICAEPSRTATFYGAVLGLRLVKVTVNQDDVGTYHLYFGNRIGEPGTVLTFFPWSSLPQGTLGSGMVTRIAFAVPQGSLAFWEARLAALGVATTHETTFAESSLVFSDPDGLPLALREAAVTSDWTAVVNAASAIACFAGATLTVADSAPTRNLLVEHFGYTVAAEEDGVTRLAGHHGTTLDIIASVGDEGVQGLGTVHHIAFRTSDRGSQEALRKALTAEFLRPTPIIDRYYFASVYFREPGGILFEIATDGPGFTVDEPEPTLGESLSLPPPLRHARAAIERVLPPFTRARISGAHGNRS